MQNKNEKRFVYIVLLSIIFGIGGGIFGEIITRAYIFEKVFGLSFFGEINYDANYNGVPNLIIRDAKKVVVEQDQKISDTAASIGGILVGIYKKEAFVKINTPALPGPPRNLCGEKKIASSCCSLFSGCILIST